LSLLRRPTRSSKVRYARIGALRNPDPVVLRCRSRLSPVPGIAPAERTWDEVADALDVVAFEPRNS
jgi:hypothetical protein